MSRALEESLLFGVGHDLTPTDQELGRDRALDGGGSDKRAASRATMPPNSSEIGETNGSNKLRRAFSYRNPFFRSNTVSTSSANGNNNNNAKDSDSNKSQTFRKLSWKKFWSRFLAQHNVNFSAKQNAAEERVPPLGGYQWPPDQTPGVIGLRNHGNTCFMNAVLQCLSHTDILAEYFVMDQYKADLKRRNKINSKKFGTNAELTEQLALVLKALWTCRDTPEHSTSFKAVVDRYGSQFRSSTQHDAQEFLFWLLDKVHEDLNTATKRKYKAIKNNYGRPDEVIAAETLANHIRCNNSFVQAVFQAQFRSSLTCPRCHKQSNTFDPFHCISVQLPQLVQQPVFVTVLYTNQHPRQVKLGLNVPPGSPITALKEQLHTDTGIPMERIILTEIFESGFGRVFCDSHPMSSIKESDPVYCIETPKPPETQNTNSKELTRIMLCILNVRKKKESEEESGIERFGTPLCIQVNRDISYTELQKLLLKEMASVLKSEVFCYATPLTEMFKLRLQDPSADPETYLEATVEHPLFTEMIDLALSVQPSDAGPSNVKLLLEWEEPEKFFSDMSDPSVEHESVTQLKKNAPSTSMLTLEQCLDHYTKAETLSSEDAWRCPHCQKYLPVVKTLGLWSLPDILVVHFKRFRQPQLKGPQAAKLTTMVRFPLQFDMSPHLAKSSAEKSTPTVLRRQSKKQINPDKDTKYDLYAVCSHQGETLETGHYTAACRNPYDHQWYKFDDQRVNLVPKEKMEEEIINNEAYILFYQRRKLDEECSGSSSTSSADHWISKIAPPIPNSVTTIPEKEIKTPVEETTPKENSEELVKSEDVIVDEVKVENEEQEPEEIKDEPKISPQNLETEKLEQEIVELKPEIIEEEIKQEVAKLEENLEKLDKCKIEEVEEEEVIRKTSSPEKAKREQIRPVSETTQVIIKSSPIPIKRTSAPNWSKAFDDSLDNVRHPSLSFPSRDAVSLLRAAGSSSCSKDTLLFIDQQRLEEETSILGGSHALWISPVSSHKLITVSPKN